ncbi:MAG: hypothetical protein JSS91_02870 [Bacteroidetes bacterium]|nr:hypothetical protein [Bacteroidota bacterium]
MKKSTACLLLIIFTLFCLNCNDNPKQKSVRTAVNLYTSFAGEREGFKVWIVNGDEVRKNYFDEFVYGGNSQRYPFIPADEIWIDNSISCEEFETTLAHEINERGLMERYGMSYEDAHDSSLTLEVKMRKKWETESRRHEETLSSVPPEDSDSTTEIENLTDKIKLRNIYRIPLGERNGVSIWIVDGYAVRRDIFPDFGFSGNGREYLFIPENEIWIDGQISCQQTELSIALELKERELMKQGNTYDDSYTTAMETVKKLRKENDSLAADRPEVKKTDPPFRDTGVKKE